MRSEKISFFVLFFFYFRAHIQAGGPEVIYTRRGFLCVCVKKNENPQPDKSNYIYRNSFNLFISLKWLASRGANGLFRDLLLFSFSFLPQFSSFLSFLFYVRGMNSRLLHISLLTSGLQDAETAESRAVRASGMPTRREGDSSWTGVDYANKLVFGEKKKNEQDSKTRNGNKKSSILLSFSLNDDDDTLSLSLSRLRVRDPNEMGKKRASLTHHPAPPFIFHLVPSVYTINRAAIGPRGKRISRGRHQTNGKIAAEVERKQKYFVIVGNARATFEKNTPFSLFDRNSSE